MGQNPFEPSEKRWIEQMVHAFFVILFYTILYLIFFSPMIFSGRVLDLLGDGMAQSVSVFYPLRTV